MLSTAPAPNRKEDKMTQFIEFTSNYSDRSTERGFQWEFSCQRCGNGYRSKFHPSVTGLAHEVLDTANGLLGGILGRASEVGERVHSAARERAHDAAFLKASQEVRSHFVRCPHCNEWVCRARCWNESRGLCFDCAPDVAVEAAAAQADAIAAQATEQVQGRQYDLQDYVRGDNLRAACPNCGSALQAGAKFCAECGIKVEPQRFCTACGGPVSSNAKFCPECGARQS